MRERLEVQNFLHFNAYRTERTANRNTWPGVGRKARNSRGVCEVGD